MQPVRLVYPRDFTGIDSRMGCYFLLQRIFQIQRSNSHLLRWQTDYLTLSHQVQADSLPLKTIQVHIFHLIFLLSVYLFWPHGTACETSLNRNRTHAPCSRSSNSQPLDYQGSPLFSFLIPYFFPQMFSYDGLKLYKFFL